MQNVHCESSYFCSFCDKKFKTKSQLTQHEVYHTGDIKTTECKVCGVAVKGSGKSRMASHMESHLKKTMTNLECENCDYHFRCQTTLIQHKQMYHDVQK